MVRSTQWEIWWLAVIGLLLCRMATPAKATNPAGLVAQWNFDQGQGNVLSDSSGNGNHGQIHGAKWARAGDGYALVFDKIEDHVDFAGNPSLQLTGPMTVEAWIKPMNAGWDGGGLIGTSAQGYLLTYRTGIGPSQAERGLCQWNIGGENVIRAKLRIGQWNHIAGTFDGTTMELWVNGRLKGSHKSFGPPETRENFTICSAKPVPSYARLDKLADQVFGASATRASHFQGALDHVRLYNRAVSGTEITAHFKTEAANYGFNSNWFHRVKAKPFYYFDKGLAVVELDYKGLRPLDSEGRILVTLSKQGDEAASIASQTIEPLPDSGIVEAKLPCENLANGTYVISITLQDGNGTRPKEQITFNYPPKPVIPSPVDKTVGSLPLDPLPVPFELQMGASGGFELLINGTRYPFESRISWPHGDFNQMLASDNAGRHGERSWDVHVTQDGSNRYTVQGSGSFYTIERRITVLPTHVYIKDTFTNTTADDLGLLIYNEMPLEPQQVTGWRLGGYDGRRRMSFVHQRGYGGLSTFVTDSNVGIGMVPMDDVYVAQGVLYAENGRIGMGTERFALAPKSSYTLEWTVYPTGTGDYYDFINTFRKVENRIGSIDGGVGIYTYSPGSRRQIPSKELIEKQSLKYGIISGLARAADDPQIGIQGVEFLDFPKERAMLRKQAVAIHKRYPNFKAVFHIAHSLYATNNPDRFLDSKVIGKNGKQSIHNATYGWIGKERQDAGWKYWIFYPTPGNSFHKAMMQSVDMMMDEIGMDGGFFDGFFAPYGGKWTYDGRWDGHSAEIDPESKMITRKIGSVLLLSQPSLIAIAQKIKDKGGVVIANGAIITRSIANQKHIVFDAEHLSGPEGHLAPTVMALGGGETEKQVYLDTLDKLSWGVLLVPYGVPRGIGHKLTRSLLSAREFPMTFEEIRSGMVRGKQRIVTMNSGVYGWRKDRLLHQVHKYDARGDQPAHDFITTVDPGGVRTELEFSKNESAVIEPIPVTLDTVDPVNLQVLRYDNQEGELNFKIRLNGHAEAMLDVFVGGKYFPGSDTYRVTTGNQTTTIAENDGTLSIPLNLNGQIEVAVESISEQDY